MSLTSIDGKKLGEPKAPELTERNYLFVMRPRSPDSVPEHFAAYGVLVVTPGFVGIGNKEQTEIRACVPLDNVWYVTEQAMGAAQGSA